MSQNLNFTIEELEELEVPWSWPWTVEIGAVIGGIAAAIT